MTYKKASVDQLVGGVEHLLRERRVTVVSGEARFERPGLLSVMQTGRRFEIAANHIVLAPGSLPSAPRIEGCDLPNVITSTEALTFDMVPARLVVVGGGVIGLEFACIYEALGSQVTVLEMAPNLLPGATDDAIAKRLQLILRRRGISIQTGAAVERIARDQGCAQGLRR